MREVEQAERKDTWMEVVCDDEGRLVPAFSQLGQPVRDFLSAEEETLSNAEWAYILEAAKAEEAARNERAAARGESTDSPHQTFTFTEGRQEVQVAWEGPGRYQKQSGGLVLAVQDQHVARVNPDGSERGRKTTSMALRRAKFVYSVTKSDAGEQASTPREAANL